ncbi:3-oxoacyl-ACP reductase [Streptomyces polyrhachis]|uniref:3-oxoacyl-ACP reductase n=1 Tax=Streptomyces polyrhachis TaxID=1282885 RepID=A0ABW2GGB3_9ACTN
MADRYQKFTAGGPGGFLAKRLGLPRPEPLRRHAPGDPLLTGPALLAGADGGRLLKPVRAALESASVEVSTDAERPAALVFDATGITSSAELAALYAFFHPKVRALAPSGRVVVLGTPPELAASAAESAAQRAVEGFVRAIGKELRRGGTANLLLVAPGAEEALESSLRFLLSARSAYVSGQPVRLFAPAAAVEAPASWDLPLAGRSALVTGASRGIGAVVAQTLSRDGATVTPLDIAAQSADLAAVAGTLGTQALELDITAPEAAEAIAARYPDGLDILVHNAGITRDRTLGRMDQGRWDSVIAVNLTAVETLTAALLEAGVLRAGARIVCTSSISGIAGNMGQTNYSTSKAGLIGYVDHLAPELAPRGITLNAVAPGFIETQMTAAVPLFIREAGRRLNSLNQGGLPVDVAEAVAYFAAPASGAVRGQTLRVCGQALLGA